MSHTTYTPAVAYSINPDGTLCIMLTRPWNDTFQLDAYPAHIQKAVREAFFHTANAEECRKLAHARELGEPTHSAVLDDLLCQRAQRIHEHETALKILGGNRPTGSDADISPHLRDYIEGELER